MKRRGKPASRGIVAERRNTKAVLRLVRDGLTKYNVAAAGSFRYSTLVLSARQASGVVVGGLLCHFYWNAAHVELLWISETARGSGHGRRLMEEVERRAHRRGTRVIYLSTFSFQAPKFYEKLGYRRFGQLKKIAHGTNRLFYAKYLART
jgi:ribosomal protein S18 acetylase RimI-like enzyme